MVTDIGPATLCCLGQQVLAVIHNGFSPAANGGTDLAGFIAVAPKIQPALEPFYHPATS